MFSAINFRLAFSAKGSFILKRFRSKSYPAAAYIVHEEIFSFSSKFGKTRYQCLEIIPPLS